MFTHHNLKVYDKALTLAGCAEKLSAPWGRRHAVVEQFRRASESIVLNIAEGARLPAAPDKAKTLDYAIGSSLECAACLDIASIKGFLNRETTLAEKRSYAEVTRMLVGLRKAWLVKVMREEPDPYQPGSADPDPEPLFHHESLDVYKTALEFMAWFVGLPGAMELSDRLCRQVDKSATSLVLNVAEGNGRYSELDHRRFLEMAALSAVKAAAYLDLYQRKAIPTRVETLEGKELLSRIIAMLNRF